MVLIVTICTVMSLTCIFATLSMIFSICEWGCSSLGMATHEACCRRSPSPLWRGCGCKGFALIQLLIGVPYRAVSGCDWSGSDAYCPAILL
jgi:hypothetical protein